MRLIIALFLLAVVIFAETPAKEKNVSPEELIEGRIAALTPALQAVAWQDLATLPQWSRERATGLRVRAFEAMLQSHTREELPAPEAVVNALLGAIAQTDPELAQGLMLRLPAGAGRRAAREFVVKALVAKGRIDEAEQAIHSAPTAAEFPFGGVHDLMQHLAEGDARRITWFAQSLRMGENDAAGFAPIFRDFQAKMPRELRVKAAGSLLASFRQAAKGDEDSRHQYQVFTSNGPATFTRESDWQAYAIREALLEADEGATKEFIKERPNLSELLSQKPAPESLGVLPLTTVGPPPADLDLAAWARDNEYSRQSGELAAKDFQGALALAGKISDPMLRLGQEITIYSLHPREEFDVEKAFGLIQKADHPDARFGAACELAKLLHERGQTANRDRALRLALAAVEESYEKDSNPDRGNGAWRGMWQSVQNARRLGFEVGNYVKQAEAEDWLRVSSSEPSLQTIVRVGMLQRWRGVADQGPSFSGSAPRPAK